MLTFTKTLKNPAARVSLFVALAAISMAPACDDGPSNNGQSNVDAGAAQEDASVPDSGSVQDASNPKHDAAVDATGGSHDDAGNPHDAAAIDTYVPPAPGVDATVDTFHQTPIFFDDWSAAGNQRQVDVDATFPATGSYDKITLHLALDCRNNACDPWDRYGTLGVVTQKGVDGGADTVIEVMRFMTPYGVGWHWDLDVTDLRPLLNGKITLRAFIDTWVPQGNPGANGYGWTLTASFEMKGGIPSHDPIAAIPVWTARSIVYGDPNRPISQGAPPQTVAVPAGSAYALRTFITGHGQGNSDNCAEFCSRQHTMTVGSAAHTATIFRTDCATTTAPNQHGTFQYSRAGWCPGADVHPWTEDITHDVAGQSAVKVAYDVESYTNTCRPGVTTCSGCSLGTGCDYDGGNHTEPNYYVSALLIAYR